MVFTTSHVPKKAVLAFTFSPPFNPQRSLLTTRHPLQKLAPLKNPEKMRMMSANTNASFAEQPSNVRMSDSVLELKLVGRVTESTRNM